MAEGSEGFVVPIFVDDGGTIATMVNRLDALEAGANRAARAYQEAFKGKPSGYPAVPRIRPTAIDEDKPKNLWERELAWYRKMAKDMEQMKQLRARVGTDVGSYNVLAETTKEKLSLEAMQGPEQAFLKLAMAAAKANSALKLYQADQITSTREMLNATAAVKARVSIEERMATAIAKSAQSYRATEEAVLRQEAANKQATAELRLQLDMSNKLASARARAALAVDSAYQTESEALKKLTRAEMEKAETDKLIDKLYRDRAKAAAYSSQAYKSEAEGLGRLSMESRVVMETAKLLEQQQQKVAKATALLNPQVRALTKEYDLLTKQQQRSASLSASFSESMAGTNQITAGFRAALAGVGMGFGIYTSGTIIAASATYTLISAFRDVIASGAEFESSMARVNAAMGLTKAQYDDLSERAVKMANASRYSTDEIVKAYREMAMSGFTYQETVDGIDAVIAMASIGMMEFGKAADIATNVLFGFNLQAKDLTMVVDVMAKTITSSAQDLEQLGNTMSYVAPVASSFGVSLQMVAASTEVLANAGIKGSRSGTGLRRTLTALFSDSENVGKVLSSLGVTVNTMASDMDQEFLRVMRALNVATNGATSNIGALTKAVGIYAIPAFLNLVKAADGSVNSLGELAKKYDDVGGAAFEMQKRMEAALAVDWEKALAAVSAIKTELYQMYGGNLREFVQGMTSWIRSLADSKDILRETISLLKELVKTVGEVTLAILSLSALKGLYNFGAGLKVAGSNAIQAYRDQKEIKALAANVAAPAAVSAAALMGARIGAPTATATEAAAISAVADATKKAGEATTLWAASKKLLGYAFRAVPYVGTALILKDMYDIYTSLNRVVPQQTSEVNRLADAQKKLNGIMHGFRLSATNEGAAIEVAKTKQAVDDMGGNIAALQNNLLALEGQLDTALSMPKGPVADVRIKLLSKEIESLRAQLRMLLDEAKAGEDRLSSSSLVLIANERRTLEAQALELERKRDEAKEILDKINARMTQRDAAIAGSKAPAEEWAQYKKQFDQMSGLDLMLNGLSPNSTFDDYLASVSPSLAKLVKELYDAETSYSQARHASERFNESLSTQRTNLDAAESGLKDYGVTMKDTVTSIAQARKVADFFTELATSIRRVREESELDNATQEEKIAIYHKKIQEYDYTRKRVEEMQGRANELVKTIEYLESKEKLSGPEGLDEKLRKQLAAAREQLSAFEAGVGWLKGNEGQRLEWEKGILKSGEKIEGTTKQVNGLHDALWDLFNLPNEMDFAKTLKGQIDFAIAQADALLSKYTRLQGEYKALPSVPSPGKPGSVGYRTGSPENKAIVSALEAKYALSPGVLDAVWAKEFNRAGAEKIDYSKIQGTLPTLIKGPFQIGPEVFAAGVKRGLDMGTFAGHAEAAAMELAAAQSRGLSPYDQFRQYHGGANKANWGAKTNAYAADAVQIMGSQTAAQLKANQAVADGKNLTLEAAVADQERTKSAIDLSDALLGMAKTNELIATSIDAQVAKEQQGYSDQDLRNLLAKENELRAARLKLRGEMAELAKTPIDNLTQEQIDNRQKLIELDKQWAEQIGVMTEKCRALQEEEIKQGKLETKLYTRTPEELKAIAEGYDSAWARSRKYYESMEKIIAAEEAGYLTHTEAMLEKINADLANMDPLTKDMATNLVQAITDVATGASKSSDAVDNLKKSLKNLVMEKFVVKIGIDLIGTITQPISVGLQELGGSILKGVGSMLLTGLGSLAGGMANAFGSLGVEGSGNAAQAMGNTAGGLMSTASSISNIFSMGSALMSGTTGAFLQGAMAGFSNLFSGTFTGVGMQFATAGIAGGSSMGMAGGIGYMMPYLLPIAIGVGFAISKWFKDQEPRQGAFSATTFGGPQGLEDWQNGADNYSKGGFGLMFGLSDNGSKNIDASEFKEFFDAMAKTTQTMEDFYGPEVSKKVEEALKKYSMENWTKDGVMRLSMDSDQALRDIINMISDAAAATGDEVAQILDSLLGTLSGTAEEIAKQLETAMNAVEGILKSTTDLRGTAIGDAFGLTGTAAENALKLVEFAKGLIETGETAVEAAQRVIGELGSLQFALDQTATSIEGLNQTQIAQLASDLADAYGSATKLAEAQAKYFTEFFSASEQATINMRRTLATLGDAWTKLQEKMNGLVGPKAVNIVVPELKKDISESLKEGTSDLGSDIADMLKKLNISNAGSYLDLYSQFPMAEDQQKKIEEALLNALNNSDFAFGDQWKELYDKIKNGITPEELNKFLTDMIDSGQVAGLDGFRMLLNDSTSQNLFGAKVTGKTSGMTPEEANKNATAVLKAAESYSRGVASGAIERNLELEAKIQAAIDSYASELTAMGYDVTKGVFALADQIKNWAQTSFLSAAEQMAADNIKDPNAEIYARLVSGDLPKTRDEFNKLIGSINLQTEAGRTLYAELMKLVDAFDAMYDAIEGFESWLGVKDDREIAKSRLDKVFHDLGLQLPATKDALKQLYLSGKLTAEQLAILGANLEDLTAYYGNTDNWDPREDLTNATIARLQSQLDKFNEDLSKSRNIVQSASNALENLRKSATSVESYQEDIRVRARAALSLQRLPDDIDQIIQGLGNINQSDYGTYEDYMAAMLENDNLLRQIKLRAENQVSWDEKQVKLLQEQIDLQKEAILKERVELYEKIKGLEADLLAAQNKLANLWDTGIGATNRLLGTLQTEMQIQGNRSYVLVESGFLGIAAILNDMNGKIPAATKQLAVPDLEYEPVTAKETPDNADTENQMDELIAEVHLLRIETRETQLALAATTKKQMDMLYRWEGDGLPPDREDYLRQIAFNTRSTATVSPCQ